MIRSAILALCVSGCASQPYWTLTEAPVPVEHVVHVDYPCGQRWDACWNAKGRTIELRKRMTAHEEECRLRHEYAHARGWRHPLNMELALDCGPEEI